MAAAVPLSPNAEVSLAVLGDIENMSTANLQGLLPGSLSSLPSVTITEQPKNKWRYRYQSEKGSHGPLQGCSSSSGTKTFPTVKVINCPEDLEIHVKASLWTVDKNPVPHVHKLYGPLCSEDGTCTLKINKDGTAVFQDLTILFMAKKYVPEILFKRMLEEENLNMEERELKRLAGGRAKVMNLNCVKIRFEAVCFIHDQDKMKDVSLCSVFSEPVANQRSPKDGDLKICRMSRFSGSASGGDEVFLLCSKVDKKEIQVRFYESSSSWEAFGNFAEADVHQQCAIVFQTPAYWQRDITEQVTVFLELQRKNGDTSEAKEFTYIPCDPDDERVSKKRKKNCLYEDFNEPGGDINRNFGTQLSNTITPTQNSPMSVESANDCSLGSASSFGGFSEEELGAGLSMTYVNPLEEWFNPAVFNIKNPTLEYTDVLHNIENPALEDTDVLYNDPVISQPNVPKPRWNLSTDAATLNTSENVENQSLAEEDESSVKSEEIEGAFGQMFISDPSVPVSENSSSFKAGTNEHLEITTEGTAKKGQNTTSVLPKTKECKKCKPRVISDSSLKLVWDTFRIAVQKQNPCDFLRKIPQVMGILDEHQNTVLHVAVSLETPCEIIECLLKTAEKISYSLINSVNADHKTPLHIATKAKKPSIVKLLLRYGADPIVTDRQGFTSYHLAIYVNSNECLRELLQKANYKSPPLTFHLDCTDYEGLAPLHYAVKKESLECITLLLMNGADVNVMSKKDGRTPLHWAVLQNSKVARVLLSKKDIDVNAQDYAGNTPLHIACSWNNSEVVRMLMSHEADPTICSYESTGCTAYYYAEGNEGIMKILVSSDDVNRLEHEMYLEGGDSSSCSSKVHPPNRSAEMQCKSTPDSDPELVHTSEGDSGYISGKLSILKDNDLVQKLSEQLDPPSDSWQKLMMFTIVDEDFEKSILKLTSHPTKAILTSFLNGGGTVESLIAALDAAELFEARNIVIQHIAH